MAVERTAAQVAGLAEARVLELAACLRTADSTFRDRNADSQPGYSVIRDQALPGSRTQTAQSGTTRYVVDADLFPNGDVPRQAWFCAPTIECADDCCLSCPPDGADQ
ncbi:hypothetical protein MCHIJ_06000 [Mycolicibacterium chitae]|nr:hypothetical protein MCHIJ_06000 [Mycolicibacterium chitae]